MYSRIFRTCSSHNMRNIVVSIITNYLLRFGDAISLNSVRFTLYNSDISLLKYVILHDK